MDEIEQQQQKDNGTFFLSPILIVVVTIIIRIFIIICVISHIECERSPNSRPDVVQQINGNYFWRIGFFALFGRSRNAPAHLHRLDAHARLDDCRTELSRSHVSCTRAHSTGTAYKRNLPFGRFERSMIPAWQSDSFGIDFLLLAQSQCTRALRTQTALSVCFIDNNHDEFVVYVVLFVAEPVVLRMSNALALFILIKCHQTRALVLRFGRWCAFTNRVLCFVRLESAKQPRIVRVVGDLRVEMIVPSIVYTPFTGCVCFCASVRIVFGVFRSSRRRQAFVLV